MGAYGGFSSQHSWRRISKGLIAITLAGVLIAHWTSPALAVTPSRALVRLPGHVLEALKDANPLPPSTGADAEPVTLTIVLSRADHAGFDRYLRDVYDPQSANFRHFLGQRELAARFGPTQETYDGVLTYLRQSGFQLLQDSPNRLTLTVRGTRAQAEGAFKLAIRDYQMGNRQFYANDRDPSLPAELGREVQAIAGLSSAPLPAAPLGQATPAELATCEFLFTRKGKPFALGFLAAALASEVVLFFATSALVASAAVGGIAGFGAIPLYCIGLVYGIDYGPRLGFGPHSASVQIPEQTA